MKWNKNVIKKRKGRAEGIGTGLIMPIFLVNKKQKTRKMTRAPHFLL
jgi:hypothetical protein